MRIILNIFFLVLFAVLLIFYIDFDQIVKISLKVNWVFIIISIILGIIYSLINAIRLTNLLQVIGKISYSYIWHVSNIGSLLSAIFPFSAGGFTMPYIIAKKLHSSYKKILGVVIVDAYISLPLTIVLGIIAIPFFINQKKIQVYNLTENLQFLLIIFILVFLLLAAAFFLLRIFGQKFRLLINIPKEILFKLPVIKVILITALGILTATVQQYILFNAFGMAPPIIKFMLAGSILNILNLIPLTPMKLGQYETTGTITYAYLLNLDNNAILSMFIMQRIIAVFVTFTAGFFSLYFLRFDQFVIKKASIINKLFHK